MPQSLRASLPDTIRKPLAMRGESLPQAACGDERLRWGRAIERALMLIRVEKKEAAAAMGYTDQSALSRWIAGVETPQFDKLERALGTRFRRALLLALADGCDGVVVEQTIKVSA